MRRELKDEYAIVLDFLPFGRPGKEGQPLAQVVGEKYFALLEVAPRRGIVLRPGERVYIGPEKRDKVHHIVGRLKLSELTTAAKREVVAIVERIVEEEEKRFVDFFNKAGPITTRLHQLELLPGVGKRHMWKILEEREKKPFESFEDLNERVSLLPDAKRMIVKRILMEMEDKDKHKFFVLPTLP